MASLYAQLNMWFYSLMGVNDDHDDCIITHTHTHTHGVDDGDGDCMYCMYRDTRMLFWLVYIHVTVVV